MGIQLFFNGPEAFTPDGVYYLGESPEVDRCFVAAGFNSVGIQSAGGVGWVLADWIIDGHPPSDLWPVDIRRAQPHQTELGFLEQRISESLGLLYAMHWPFYEYQSARDVKLSALHDRLDEAGAVFGEMSGMGAAQLVRHRGDGAPLREYSYGKQNWWKASGEECLAVRHAVGLFDQTSFVKFEVEGPDAARLLGWVSSGRVPGPVGRVVYTQWLNPRGGIEADLTVTRLSEERFLVVSGSGAPVRDGAHLRRAARGHDVRIRDITNTMTTLGVMGPELEGPPVGAHRRRPRERGFPLRRSPGDHGGRTPGAWPCG